MNKKLIVVIIMVGLLILARYIRLPIKYNNIVLKHADYFNIEPELVLAIIKSESNFNPNAISRSGAKGLMQIMDKTGIWAAEELKMEGFESDWLFKPDINIYIGCWYLSRLINQYNGDIDVALAAYNAGTGNIYKWRSNREYSLDGITLDYIPFGETRRYVKKVRLNYRLYKYLYWDVDKYVQ